ncbi:Ubiquitin-2 like Rad60 SUMO-like [Novymonas esmeraldas]|uniref:Ubiquitin-2 like Rad60 SUMO-like n=1 Tax=Novymonas esmeraldas TaxID=1808958 RepID=A0AAW0EVE1_9TRYP
MDRVRVRYVLTGACLAAYSGRVVHAIVPLRQPDGSATTVETLKAQFRVNWPAEMKELADSIVESPIRVLKTGRVLNDGDVLEQQLTATERETCLVPAEETVGEAAEEMQKPSVLMHMVIQKTRPPPAEEKSKKEKNKASSTSDGGNSGDAHEVRKDSCCCVM